jgi:hypothetical protein
LVNGPRHLGPSGPSGGSLAGFRGRFITEIGFKFEMNLDFGKILRNFTRRLRRNLDMRIFPKFF